MKPLGYKDIIKNMVWNKVTDFVSSRAKEHYASVDEIELTPGNKENDYPTFDAKVSVNHWSYYIGGYIDYFGDVRITVIHYDRMRCTQKDEHGEWITESVIPFYAVIYGEDLKSFVFND